MPKLHLATKECGEASTCSSQADLTHLANIRRILLQKLQFDVSFPWQDKHHVTEGLGDAGEYAKIRRSTSGGVLRHGRHTLCAWSPSQKAVALSSHVSEYYSVVRCANEANDLDETLKEMQSNYITRRWARVLALGTGDGQNRHMQAKSHWRQDCIRAGLITV
jgi:hypothetical protein